MILKKKALSDQSGGVIILVALMFGVLMSVLGLAVDVSRVYVTQAKLQAAADAAILGAVSTASTTNVATEATRIFNANFPAGYMGATVTGPTVVNAAGDYVLTLSASVPLSIMQMFGASPAHVTVGSRVNVGYQLSSPQALELALVFDNSGTADVASMKQAGNTLKDLIFANSNTLSNVHVSVLPYDVAINVGNNRVGWVQSAWTSLYNLYSTNAGGTNGFISNRNSDAPPNTLVDVSDVVPTTDATRFRVPYSYGSSNGNNGNGPQASCALLDGTPIPCNNGNSFTTPDYVAPTLAKMQFGLNSKTNIGNALNSMVATGGNRRINVGLMWGWYTLSPNWMGLWTPSLPGLPNLNGPLLSKQMVLVVSGNNNVYLGASGQSDDNTTTRLMCEGIKSRSILLYVVAFGAPGTYNQTLLQNCATGPGYYFTATNASELNTVFQSIADAVQHDTLHLVE